MFATSCEEAVSGKFEAHVSANYYVLVWAFLGAKICKCMNFNRNIHICYGNYAFSICFEGFGPHIWLQERGCCLRRYIAYGVP